MDITSITSHTVQFRFMPNTFRWQYLRIAEQGRADIGKCVPIPPQDLISIFLQAADGQHVEVHRVPWPSGVSSDHAKLLDRFRLQKNIKLVVPAGVLDSMHGVAKACADRGWVTPMKHLMPLGRVA
jgi:hypothetical protein